VEWITLTPDNLRWTSKHVAHLGQLLSVEIQASYKTDSSARTETS